MSTQQHKEFQSKATAQGQLKSFTAEQGFETIPFDTIATTCTGPIKVVSCCVLCKGGNSPSQFWAHNLRNQHSTGRVRKRVLHSFNICLLVFIKSLLKFDKVGAFFKKRKNNLSCTNGAPETLGKCDSSLCLILLFDALKSLTFMFKFFYHTFIFFF